MQNIIFQFRNGFTAINRLKIIVKNYDKTIFIEEALHRLVEINYHLGLEEEAKIMPKY